MSTLYREMTGYEMTLRENIGYCPFGFYDESTNNFYSLNACGGTCGDYKFRYYIYDYTEDEDNYYVYVAYDVIENSTDMIDETNYLSHKKMKFYFYKDNDDIYLSRTVKIE